MVELVRVETRLAVETEQLLSPLPTQRSAVSNQLAVHSERLYIAAAKPIRTLG